MSSDVTMPGPGGATLTLSFTSAQFSTLAQNASDTALTLLNQPSIPGIGPLFSVVGYNGTGSVQSPPLLGELDITGSNGNSLNLLPTGFLSIVNQATVQQVMLNTMTQPTTVTSGTGGIVYANLSSNNTDFLAGGVNLIAEEFPTSASLIYTDAATGDYTVNNSGGNSQLTAVEALAGSTTVIASGGSALQIFSGSGNNVVSVGAGIKSFVQVSNADTVGGTTTAVTVTATSGELDFSAAGAPAVINAGAANVVVLSGGSGAVTLFGGTGSDTVSAGPSGLFQAGSGGNSVLNTSSVAAVAAATTLIGGASGDALVANASGADLVAGAGTESLYTTGSQTGGVRFQAAANGGHAVDNITGSLLGGDTVGLNAGSAVVSFLFGNVNHVSIAAGGGADTINFFRPGTDVFSLGGASVTSDTYNAGGSGNTVVTLSDSTTVTFVGVNMQTSNFS